MKKSFLFLNIVLSILLFCSSIIFFTKVVINFRPLYYYDVVSLNIENQSAMDVSTIKSNYDYLVNYLNSSSGKNFSLPTLKSSEKAVIHFQEVYNLINTLSVILFVFTLLLIIGIFITIKKKQFLYLKISGIGLILLPILFIPISFINFDDFFTFFHQLVFHNNYWIFDPDKDPVILILPEQFFMHCLISIVVLSFLFGIILLYAYKKITNKRYLHNHL